MPAVFIPGAIIIAAAVAGPFQDAVKQATEIHKQRLTGLIRALGSNDASTRLAAAQDIGKMGPAAKAAVPSLKKGLKDPNFDVQIEVIHALAAIGPDAKEAIPDLFQLSTAYKSKLHKIKIEITCSAFSFRQNDAAAISFLSAIPDLFQSARIDESYLFRASTFALEQIGPAIIPFLIQEISAEKVDASVCESATRLLRDFGCRAVSAVPALVKLLNHDDPYIRGESADALAWILASRDLRGGKEGQKIQRSQEYIRAKEMAVSALIKALTNDPDMTVRWAAGGALSMQKATAAIPALLDRMEKEQGTRDFFASCLGLIGPDALPPVLKIIADKTKTGLRLTAFDSLNTMMIPHSDRMRLDKKSVENEVLVLREVLKEQNENLRSSAVRALEGAAALEEMGAEARTAIPDLIETLKDQSINIRISAARTIFALDHNNLSGLPLLIELLDDKTMRESATRAITTFGEKAVPKLTEALYDSNGFIRRPVIWVLGEMRFAAKDAIPHLEQAIRDLDSMNAARRVAISALSGIAKDAIPLLEKAITNDEQVRRDVEQSLERIRGLR